MQAFFNLLQALTTPLFFVFLALAQTTDLAVPDKVPVTAGSADVDGALPDAPEGESLPEGEAAEAAPEEPDAAETNL